MNEFDSQLHQMIYLNKSIIPPETCNSIIKIIDKKEWQKHTYNGEYNNRFSYDEKELDVQYSPLDIHQSLCPFIIESINNYSDNYFFKQQRLINKFSLIRFNRYCRGQKMRQHCDHITTLFDGNERGIPILSIVINLNNSYCGGELFFWKDYSLPLSKGDIVIFPSGFLFPHGVKEITKGKRYSAVSWAW